MTRRAGTENYDKEAPALLKQYESATFLDVHGEVAHLLPSAPSDVLDIGAGTGRDAAWFAAQGHRVTAIEPTDAMRLGAMALHPSPAITWIDDGLPELAAVRGRSFDLVWLSAVWMHFTAAERAQMMPVVGALVRDRGSLMISLRYGPIPEGRRMFEVTADETIALATAAGLSLRFNTNSESARAPGVRWTRLWFVRGT